MALVSLPVGEWWERPGVVGHCGGSVAPAVNSTRVTLDAAGEYVAVIFQARQDMTISHVGWRPGTVTGSPTADVRIETVATTGLPSGTLWAANTNIVSGTLTAAWRVDALTASASISAGEFFCVKFVYNSGTSFIFVDFFNYYGTSTIPYWVDNTGTPTKAGARTSTPQIALGSSSAVFYNLPVALPIATLAANTFNNTNSARRGVRFRLNFSARIAGLRHYNGASTGDFTASIRDDAGNILNSSDTAFDGDQMANLTQGGNYLKLDNTVEVSANTWYRAELEPNSATNISIYTVVAGSADLTEAMPGAGEFHYFTFASAAYDDTATSTVPLLDILIDQIDNGAGGGGGATSHGHS